MRWLLHKANQDKNYHGQRSIQKENISLLRSWLNIELKKKLVRCYIWSIVWLIDLDTKKMETETLGELRNVMLKKNEEDTMARETS